MLKYTKKEIAELDKYYTYPRNLVDLFEDSIAKWGNRNAIGTKNLKTREYEWITYRDLATRVNNLRGGLKKAGLKKGDAVGVIINNSVEWFVIENATHGIGGIYVPMYEKELMKTWHYIVKDSKCKFLFVKDQALYERVKHFKKEIKTLKEIYLIYGDGKSSLASIEETGSKNPVKSYKPHWSEISNLIYTSGTTGEPKGVLLTHGNLTHCSQSGYHIFPGLNENSVSLTILPWAHSYGLSAELHNFLQFGGAMGLMESLDTVAEDFIKVKPTYLMAVPRVFNKIYDGILSKMKEEGGAVKFLFDAACNEAKKCRGKKKSLKLKILDKIVFSKIRERFGGRLEGSLTASAVMNHDIALFFEDLGIPTYDCYGLTETAPAITMNSPLRGHKYGSVGKCVDDMFVKIDKSRVHDQSEDGEILVYGAHIMMGYHNKPKETAAIMTSDRWNGFPGIRTGDQGRFDEEGFLHITGRFKDEYKLTNGKYVHPESIETEIKLIIHVANAMIYGDNKPYNVCAVVPDFEALKKDPDTTHLVKGNPKEDINNPELQKFLIDSINSQLKNSFGGYEIPKKYMFIENDFTLESGMLTQTLKLKRREVMHAYGKDILKLYEK